MRKQNTNIEWLFHENDAEWERLQALLPLEITPALRRRLQMKRSLWSVATILLVLAGTGGWWRYTTQSSLQADEAELRAAIEQMPLTVVTPANDALVTTIKRSYSGADSGYQHEQAVSSLPIAVHSASPVADQNVALQTMEIQGSQAVAQVVLGRGKGAPTRRQTRFYQRTPKGWQPAPPDASLWGAESTLQTPYFVYHFRQRDATVVQAVAPQIDALYITLWRNFGLPIDHTLEKLFIDVSVMQPPGDAVGWVKRGTPFLVSSPALYLAPLELTDADLLVQSLAFPLLDHVVAHARSHHAIGESWQPLLDGLSLWQLWDAALPVANWHDEVVRWLYNDLPANRPGNRRGQPAGLPQHYGQLCVTYKLWMKTPDLMHIPLVCAGQEWEERYWKQWSWRAPMTHLDQLGVPISMPIDELHFPDYHPGQAVAQATMIEYAVATYGRDRLPVLVASLGQHQSWNTLLPAVYGVSAAEFEAGWQAYLMAHYGVAEEHS